MKNIYLNSKSNKTKFKTYKIYLNIKKNKKHFFKKIGIYNPKLNIISCVYNKILKYLKYGFKLNKTVLKLLLYNIKNI
nr:hypothetical protein [Plasmodium elongatum]